MNRSYFNNHTDDDIRRMFEENGKPKTGKKRVKYDMGELILCSDGVYRSEDDFPEMRR